MADGLLGPAEIRELAARLGVAPTKKLGQNFLHDPNTIRRIVAAAGLRPDDVALEVGPGLGSLTLGLVGAVRHVHAVEIDPTLAAALVSLADILPESRLGAWLARPGRDLFHPGMAGARRWIGRNGRAPTPSREVEETFDPWHVLPESTCRATSASRSH